jgi:hypothetical protein
MINPKKISTLEYLSDCHYEFFAEISKYFEILSLGAHKVDGTTPQTSLTFH